MEVQSEQLSLFFWSFQISRITNIPILQNMAFVFCIFILTQSYWLEGFNCIMLLNIMVFIKNNSILHWWYQY